MVIEAKELQQEVKGFLKDNSSSYHEILENIHEDYWTQITYDHMRDESNSVPGTFIIQRGKTGDKGGKSVGTSGASVTLDALTPVKFPNNTGQLFQSEYYSQFRDWYSQMVKPPHG